MGPTKGEWVLGDGTSMTKTDNALAVIIQKYKENKQISRELFSFQSLTLQLLGIISFYYVKWQCTREKTWFPAFYNTAPSL